MSTGNDTVYHGQVDPAQTPVSLAAATDLTVATHGGKILDNTGASATLEHNLPAASGAGGILLAFYTTAAQIARFQPASGEGVWYGGSGVADKYVQLAGVIGNYIFLYCDGIRWKVVGANGVVTKEA